MLGATGLAANGGVAGLPTTINGVVAPILSAVESSAAAPGVTVSSALPSPYQTGINYNAATIGKRRYPDVRFDYNINKHHSLEFDYHYSHYGGGPDVLNSVDATYPVAPFNTSGGEQLSNRNLFVIAERWTIGSNMSNEIRLGIQSAPVNFGLGVNQGDFPLADNEHEPITAGAIPTLYVRTFNGVSQIFLGLGNTQGRNDALGEMHETFGWTHGAHQFTFGGDATNIYYNDFFGLNASATLGINTNFDPAAAAFANCQASTTTPNPLCNLPGVSATQQTNVEALYATLAGRVSSFQSTVAFNPTTRAYQAGIPEKDKEGQLEFGIYAADSWRVKPNVTFNYGLRWEYSGPPWDKDNEYYMVPNANDVFGVSGPGNIFHPGSTAGNGIDVQFVNDTGKTWYQPVSTRRLLRPSVLRTSRTGTTE